MWCDDADHFAGVLLFSSQILSIVETTHDRWCVPCLRFNILEMPTICFGASKFTWHCHNLLITACLKLAKTRWVLSAWAAFVSQRDVPLKYDLGYFSWAWPVTHTHLGSNFQFRFEIKPAECRMRRSRWKEGTREKSTGKESIFNFRNNNIVFECRRLCCSRIGHMVMICNTHMRTFLNKTKIHMHRIQPLLRMEILIFTLLSLCHFAHWTCFV